MSHIVLLMLAVTALAHGQRITTIQLDGVQYFISRMNPYSPELNYFLAYQYCRSIGLQLASFETKEKADSMAQYLSNAGYQKYDFWTSGNRLGTDMLIWMSTGLPFNATFDYMKPRDGEVNNSFNEPVARQLSAVEQKTDSGASDGCVAMVKPDLRWDTEDCTKIKDFICEQTKCYYYNYGAIPVSSSQGVIKTKFPTSVSTSATQQTTPIINLTTPSTSAEVTDPLPLKTTNQNDEDEPQQSEENQNATNQPTAATLLDLVHNTETIDTTAVPNRSQKSHSTSEVTSQESPYSSTIEDDVLWQWARNIMLEKPKKKNTHK